MTEGDPQEVSSWEDDFEVEVEEAVDESAFRASIQIIADRCNKANIEFTIEEYEDDVSMKIMLPNGRDKRPLWIHNLSASNRLLAIDFENVRFIPKYEAIWWPNEGVAEFALGARQTIRFNRYLEELGGMLTLSPDNPAFPELSIGRRTNGMGLFVRGPGRLSLTMRSPESLKFSTSEEITRNLDRFGASLLYQADQAWGTPMTLIRERVRPIRIGRTRSAPVALAYPRYEYDAAPLALYRYARNSLGMPLLQFLAYYQVVEYFFPLYSRAEAQRRMRNVLKDPRFRIERDSDIGRLISCIKETRSGAFFDERTQLRSTVLETLSAEDLTKFLSDNGYEEFFKKDYKLVHEKKIKIGGEGGDARADIAERLYGIRCKIVHTKADGADGEMELMLPYSDEEQSLDPDVQLMAYIARSCLNASGAPLG